jgi:predicted TIM-barrel fold metal-dependent hydrolase
MRIDVHAHLWTDEYLDLVASYGKADTATQRGLGAGMSKSDIAARFALMDASGIDLQVLSVSPQVPHFEDETQAVTAARMTNDLYAEAVRRWPTRFAAFAALPLPHVKAALRELDRALGEPGMLGVTITSSILGRSIADAQFDPIYEELDRRGCVLFVHPEGCGAHSPLISNYNMTWMIGAPIEETMAILHLITHGIPSRYPRLRILNTHLGGALPMVLQRLDSQHVWEAPQTPELPSLAARRMWYDTVSHGHAPALRAAADSLGADRLVLGTDFPYQSGDQLYARNAGLEDDDVVKILDTNALRLLGPDVLERNRR